MKQIKYASAVMISGLLSACGGNDSSQVSVAITDAPVDQADVVMIKFKRLILGEGEASQEFDLSDVAAIDLLTLQGDQNQFLVDGVDIPAGEYKIRFDVDAIDTSCSNPNGEEASYVEIDGVRYPLAVPSGQLKLNKSLTVAAGGSSSYTVDFDLRKALAERNQKGCYNMNPTALRVVDNSEIGALEGVVQPAVMSHEACTGASLETAEGYAVYLFEGSDVSPQATAELSSGMLRVITDDVSEPSYVYQLGFLPAGEYTAALACNTEAGDVVFLDQGNVTIAVDTTSEQNFPSES